MKPVDPQFIRRFTDDESRLIIDTAQALYELTRGYSTKIDQQNAIRCERLGVAGNWAVGDWLEVDTAHIFASPTHGGDNGIDLTLEDGTVVDVKTSNRRDAHLIIPPDIPIRHESIYVLCVRIAPATLAGMGWLMGADYRARSITRDLHRGVGPQPIVDQNKLEPMSDLVEVAQVAAAFP